MKTIYVSKAKDLLKKDGNLSKLEWYEFEKVIAELLELEGWEVYHTKRTRDGGVDIITIREDKRLGLIKVLWQIKKYKQSNPVGINTVRKLGFLISKLGASKGVIVTTSQFTKDALKLIKEHEYTISGNNVDAVITWLDEHGEEDDGKYLLF